MHDALAKLAIMSATDLMNIKRNGSNAAFSILGSCLIVDLNESLIMPAT